MPCQDHPPSPILPLQGCHPRIVARLDRNKSNNNGADSAGSIFVPLQLCQLRLPRILHVRELPGRRRAMAGEEKVLRPKQNRRRKQNKHAKTSAKKVKLTENRSAPSRSRSPAFFDRSRHFLRNISSKCVPGVTFNIKGGCRPKPSRGLCAVGGGRGGQQVLIN